MSEIKKYSGLRRAVFSGTAFFNTAGKAAAINARASLRGERKIAPDTPLPVRGLCESRSDFLKLFMNLEI